MTKKIANQLVETLVNSGVKRIYAITGDSLNEVNNAVRENGKLQWIHVRHEETGAYAAGAEAQLTGQLGCCAGSSGPGHVHLINGLYDAHRSEAPVLAIASTIPTVEFGADYFQETNTIQLFDNCSLYNQVAQTPQQFPRMLHAAIQSALGGRGVGVIGLPGDLAAQPASDTDVVEATFPVKSLPCPSEEELDQLAALLNSAQNITLFCGVGCKGAHREVVELSHRLKAPVAYTFRGKMEVEYDNPNAVGMTGLLGVPSGYVSMHEADVLVMLGTDFPYTAFLPKDKTIVQIDINPKRLGRRTKVTLGLCGDIKVTLSDLLPMLREKADDRFLQRQLNLYSKVQKALHTYVVNKGSEGRIHPEYVMYEINRHAADNAVFAVDTGMTCVWAVRYLKATAERSILGSFNHGSMANALPQSIGAALACPDRQVWALCGDGGFCMSMGDLATVAQYHLPIKIIIFNNRSLGMVRLEMEVAGLPSWQTDMQNPDFAMLARSMGIRSLTVADPSELETAIVDMMCTDGPMLVNILTSPDALAMPPKVELGQMLGFTKSMLKLMKLGRTQEVVDIIETNIKHIREML